MQFKNTIIASIPILGAIAAPTGSSGKNPDAPATFPAAYGLVVSTHVDPFHFETVNANSGKFWLNLPLTSTSCPSDVASQGACPPGTDTVFTGAGGLATVVPGGQQAYALQTGELRFTGAHANLVPQGAVSSPFVYEFQDGAQFGSVTSYAFGANGFMACPTPGSSAYQVFLNVANAQVPLGDTSACVLLGFLAVPYTQGDAAAWQYD
ncbi:hypothetical protein LTR84_004475 [Exophiala bonariae]|uniref:Ubiquitin 3 binding protein But2 C-terminal domain-containing protein n=1 Tax=Exophiala bonariae TaxID=1690606 RepID=A0AAV9N4V0_9EURO|nr:hypothetical protein LTR84_004475 [Exophiala bonariae]